MIAGHAADCLVESAGLWGPFVSGPHLLINPIIQTLKKDNLDLGIIPDNLQSQCAKFEVVFCCLSLALSYLVLATAAIR